MKASKFQMKTTAQIRSNFMICEGLKLEISIICLLTKPTNTISFLGKLFKERRYMYWR